MTGKGEGSVAIILLLFLFASCGSAGVVKESAFFTAEQKDLLEKTVQALDYGYGYDGYLDLNYIYSYSYSDTGAAQKEKEFAKIISATDGQKLFKYFIKTYKLQAMTNYKRDRFKARKNWKQYNYLKNNLSPALDRYFMLLQKLTYAKDPSFKETFEKRKPGLDEWAKDFCDYQEKPEDTF